MATNDLVLRVPHSLGAAEAQRRIASGVAGATADYGRYLHASKLDWQANRLDFSLVALAQTVHGSVEVEDDYVELRAQLLNNADDTGQHLRENEVTTDPSDRATLEEEYTLELRTRDRERKLLKKVEKSIRQIDEGGYGYCEETGEPIGVARLLARPTASLSLEAQERRERVQKLYGD